MHRVGSPEAIVARARRARDVPRPRARRARVRDVRDARVPDPLRQGGGELQPPGDARRALPRLGSRVLRPPRLPRRRPADVPGRVRARARVAPLLVRPRPPRPRRGVRARHAPPRAGGVAARARGARLRVARALPPRPPRRARTRRRDVLRARHRDAVPPPLLRQPHPPQHLRARPHHPRPGGLDRRRGRARRSPRGVPPRPRRRRLPMRRRPPPRARRPPPPGDAKARPAGGPRLGPPMPPRVRRVDDRRRRVRDVATPRGGGGRDRIPKLRRILGPDPRIRGGGVGGVLAGTRGRPVARAPRRVV